MNPYRYPYKYHPAPPPVDLGGVTPITTNQQGVAMMAPHGYISAAPSPAYPVYYGGWEQCRWVGPFRPSLLFPPPGVCTMVQAWLVLSTRLWPLCRVLIHRPGLWPRANLHSSRLLGRSPSWPLTCPMPPGVSSSPWRRVISARRTSCPRRLPRLQSCACPSGPSPVLHLREYVRLLPLGTVLLLTKAVSRTRRYATSSASSAIC